MPELLIVADGELFGVDFVEVLFLDLDTNFVQVTGQELNVLGQNDILLLAELMWPFLVCVEDELEYDEFQKNKCNDL